ncbi:hypothetical protein DFH11DRAFT_1739440 [Phellopilus nigrolimitatus]|nr:hypothetical protein DFH11DRAFT_1739440 [Phellopilus nigrolimitatus]
MAEFETRPSSVYRSGEWHPNGHSTEAGPSSSRAGRASTSSGSMNTRRRSSAAPPAGPPPSQPIPNLPALSETSTYGTYDLADEYLSNQEQDDTYATPVLPNPPTFNLNPFQRPTASSQLAAVAQFSQARLAAVSASPLSPFSSNLSDSPPRSLLPRNPQSSQVPPRAPSQEIIPDRLLLSPPDTKESVAPGKPSSRRALTRALELAREAVKLDSTNDDPHGAIQAYGQSVALLNEVMERVMRGEDSGDHRRKNGRRRSIVAQEEEVRRLKSIHDTYADRMNILSLIYSIPTSTQPPQSQSSSRSDSPSSQTSKDTQPTITDDANGDSHRFSPDTGFREASRKSDSSSGSPSMTSASAALLLHRNSIEQLSNTALNRASTSPSSKQTSGITRLRSSSNLPPRPPAPSSSPPSTPTVVEPSTSTSGSPPSSPRLLPPVGEAIRSRGNSVGHRRTGSGNRLEVLKEEAAASSMKSQQQHHYDHEADLRRTHVNGTHVNHRTNHESPPLPALPSPSNSDPGSSITPRGIPVSIDVSQQATSPPDAGLPSAYTNARPRGGSAMSSMSESTGIKALQPLINETPTMGTISQRRNKPSISSTILESYADGTEGALSKRLGTSLPNTASSLNTGRSRASSHPVRLSNLSIQGLPTEFGSRPPFQDVNSSFASAQQLPGPRKASSGFRQSPQPPSRTARLTGIPPSSFPSLTLTLVPPPPVLPGQLPTTPTSPLPPAPPTDTLRKPYHLMSLLGRTMSSKSGGYITRKLHVPYEVWSQGGAKLTNLPEKIRVVEVLCDALAEVQNASVEFCGPMGVASGMGLGVGSITRKDGEIWISKLEEFLLVCDNVVSSFGKKLSVGEGFVVKKNSGVGSWGGKLTRQLDKLTNGKNLDSPTLYVQGLQRLFQLTQLLDEHTMALNSQPIAPVYGALATDLRMTLELKLKRSSEFFASVVLTFVIRDLSQLLDKYAKKGEKWLAE